MRKCDYCGRENPDDTINCSGCASQLQEEAPVTKQTKAGFWIRAAARIIDSVFVILIATLTGAVMGIVLVILAQAGLISPGWQHRLHGFSWTALFFDTLASLSYHSFCEGLHGATLGKLCCGICVVREDGRPSNLPGAVIRSLAYFIDGLFFGAVAYSSMKKSPLNQRYGDIWGKTAVVKNDEIAPESERTTGYFLLALGLGIASYSLLVAIGLLLKAF